jgi:hypothetical protein
MHHLSLYFETTAQIPEVEVIVQIDIVWYILQTVSNVIVQIDIVWYIFETRLEVEQREEFIFAICQLKDLFTQDVNI